MATLTTEPVGISRPPTRREKFCDRGFRGLTYLAAWLTALLVLAIVFKIGGSAVPALRQYGLGFITGTSWDANQQHYGIRPQIWGTLYSSGLAVLVGTVLGLAVAVFLSERFLSSFVFRILKVFGLQQHRLCRRLPDQLEGLLKNLVELLAAIPSVVYGLWGIFVISWSLFSPANTLAALLANNFPEAGPKQVGVLMYVALVLMAITLLVNICGALILQRASRDLKGGR